MCVFRNFFPCIYQWVYLFVVLVFALELTVGLCARWCSPVLARAPRCARFARVLFGTCAVGAALYALCRAWRSASARPLPRCARGVVRAMPSAPRCARRAARPVASSGYPSELRPRFLLVVPGPHLPRVFEVPRSAILLSSPVPGAASKCGDLDDAEQAHAECSIWGGGRGKYDPQSLVRLAGGPDGGWARGVVAQGKDGPGKPIGA